MAHQPENINLLKYTAWLSFTFSKITSSINQAGFLQNSCNADSKVWDKMQERFKNNKSFYFLPVAQVYNNLICDSTAHNSVIWSSYFLISSRFYLQMYFYYVGFFFLFY